MSFDASGDVFVTGHTFTMPPPWRQPYSLVFIDVVIILMLLHYIWHTKHRCWQGDNEKK